jgi:hypothetical protein
LFISYLVIVYYNSEEVATGLRICSEPRQRMILVASVLIVTVFASLSWFYFGLGKSHLLPLSADAGTAVVGSSGSKSTRREPVQGTHNGCVFQIAK